MYSMGIACVDHVLMIINTLLSSSSLILAIVFIWYILTHWPR